MGFIIGLLTVFLVLDCLLLILLVLIQLPKKDAGAGLAFGGGATDALFGAGTGNVLTKVTKWAATFFFVLAFSLAVIQKHRSTARITEFERHLSAPAAESGLPAAKAPAKAPAKGPAEQPLPSAATNLMSVPVPTTNAPVK